MAGRRPVGTIIALLQTPIALLQTPSLARAEESRRARAAAGAAGVVQRHRCELCEDRRRAVLGQAGQPTPAGVEPHLLCEDDRRTIDEGYRNLHPKVLHYYWVAASGVLPKPLWEWAMGMHKQRT